MTLFGAPVKDWDNDLSVIRGRRSLYYQQFQGEQEILLDCVAHEREDAKSIQCVVDYVMQRWRNPLSEFQAYQVARQYVEDTKNHAAHWASWISPTLITYSAKKLAPRPPPMRNIWRQDHIKETSSSQPWSRLLSIPAELRIEILTHAVTPSTTTTPFSGKNTARGIIVGTQSSLHPALAKTCRQLRHETLPIFYSTNTFIFPITTFPALHTSHLWLSHLSTQYIASLQNILLLGFDRLPLLPLFPNLPHGLAMALAGHYSLLSVRIAINLRTITMNIETELPNGGEWLMAWEGVLQQLREALCGMEVTEEYLRVMLTAFGRDVEDLERRGRRVEWLG